MRYTFDQLKEILVAAGWPQGLTDIMAAIGLAESSGNPKAINPGFGAGGRRTREYSLGLWQINTLAHPQYDKNRLLNDPVYNAKAALEIFRKQGLRAWGAYTDGRYKSFTTGAVALDPGTGGIGSGVTSIGSGIRSTIENWLFEPVQSSQDRFAPYLKRPSVSGPQRYQIAVAIMLVVIVFAWREL